MPSTKDLIPCLAGFPSAAERASTAGVRTLQGVRGMSGAGHAAQGTPREGHVRAGRV